MISYEVSLTLIFLCVIICTGSFNLIKIIAIQEQVGSFWLPLFPIFIIFLISILAETNRAPFDLPEAEAEIVAGYNLEYSSLPFALFFLGEYGNMLLMSAITTILFFGGWGLGFNWNTYLPAFILEFSFAIKTVLVGGWFVIVRATFPRLRYDQLMLLGWTIFLPISTAFFIFLITIKISYGSFQSLTFNTILYYI
jgi:NADH-quinone oxidoreductase subunit H